VAHPLANAPPHARPPLTLTPRLRAELDGLGHPNLHANGEEGAWGSLGGGAGEDLVELALGVFEDGGRSFALVC